MLLDLHRKLPATAFILLLFLPFFASSQLQINSVSSTPITCPNNGTISINATTTVPPLLYSIIGGPLTQPVQTNPVFTSLLPGNYTIKVSDGAGNELTTNTTVGGTYNNPDFTASVVKPYCVNESNGEITGNITAGTGTPPFTWQLLAPSPVTTAAQSSNVFQNLPAGNYTVRLTDACGSYKTSVITVGVPNTANPFYGGAIVNKVGCDAMNFWYSLSLNDFRPPLTFKYESDNGSVYNYTTATSMGVTGGYCQIQQTIPGIDYGETIIITVYNDCGDSTVSNIVINPFLFYPFYNYTNCGSMATPSFNNDPTGYFNTGIMPPVSYTFTDVVTNTVVSQGTVDIPPFADINSTFIPGVTTTSVDVNKTYRIEITDGCGETFTQEYLIPGQAPPLILEKVVSQNGCIDSVVGLFAVHATGFLDGKLIITGGPATVGSTKPEFEYQDTYSYPDTLTGGSDYWLIQNLGVGTYYFKIIDTCGHELFDSIVITPQMVSDLGRDVYWEKGCLGQNKIFYSLHPEGKVFVTDLSTNTIIKTSQFYNYSGTNYSQDSVLNVPAGQYEVLFQFEQGGYANPINDNIHSCWIIRDTITIENYETPEISVGNAIMCNNTINFVLVPDSTKGVPPYQYEIISGPQTFGVQGSNVFTISQPGTYVARIYDICGNASTKQITVDTISFDPIEVNTNCSSTSLIFPTSIYFTYEWLMPNGQTYIGDSLILDPVTAADTGIYDISKIININGCIDTLHTTYHVVLPNHSEQTIPFCQGTTITVGTNTYTTPGIYSDTLTSTTGCDSIVVTHLEIMPQDSDTTDASICPGDSLLIGGQYYGLPGFYTDSIQNAGGCYDLLITHLTINGIIDTLDVSVCPEGSYSFGGNVYQTSGFYSDTLISVSGCDSISILHLTVLPYITHAANVTICQGDNYPFGGNLLTLQGVYTDTLSTSGCDSIVTLTLNVSPYIHHAATQSICQDEQYSFGGNLLNLPGIYVDTFSTAGCDSIVTLTLNVLPYKFNAITQTICEGDSYTVGGNVYTLSGTYTDTLSTASCDSIHTLTLIVLPLIHNDIYETICAGEDYPFGGTHYIHSGTYTHPFPTSTCDSIVTLHLTVNPVPNVNITSSAYETSDGIFVQLNAISNMNPLSYLWTSSAILSSYVIPNPTTTIQDPTWVYVTVTDTNGCTATDGFHVLIPVTSTLYIPNSVTPNGDEANQVFRVYGTNIAQFELEIYDRWGELIFETTDINYGWDATYMGKLVQDGIYVYKVLAIGMDYVTYDKTGHITVLK